MTSKVEIRTLCDVELASVAGGCMPIFDDKGNMTSPTLSRIWPPYKLPMTTKPMI